MMRNNKSLRSKLFSGAKYDEEYGGSYLPTTNNSQTQLLIDKAEDDIDQKAGVMVKGVRVLKEIAMTMGAELDEQNAYMKSINADASNTKTMLDNTLMRLKLLTQRRHGMLGMYCLLIGFVLFVLLVLYTWI